MPSKALQNFIERKSDIERLLKAHDAFIRFSKAEDQLKTKGQGLQKLAAAAAELGSPPKPGRPPKIDAINRAAIVLMSTHLEGFIEDLHEEAARVLLSGKVKDIGPLVADAHWRFQNPRTQSIEELFCTIGLPRILDGICWQRASNNSVRKRLNDFVKLRNNIAHGEDQTVRKWTVTYYKRFTNLLANNLDKKVEDEIFSLTSNRF